MRITKRRLLVVMVAAGQLMCLVLGLLWFAHWLENDLGRLVRRQVLHANRQIAAQMGDFIGAMGIRDLDGESDDWFRLQSMIERVELPNDGFLCVVSNDDGRLLCHPELRRRPDLRGMKPGAAVIHGPELERSIVDAGNRASFAGWARMPDGNHLIGVRRIAELNISVLAHQRERGITQAVQRVTSRVERSGYVVATVLSVLTCLITMLIVERYENRLAGANDRLEKLVEHRSRALMKTRDAVIFGLAKLAESRDDDTGEHLDRIRDYVEILARRLSRRFPELDEHTIEMLGLTSSLHDIGKVGIPDQVLLKPGKLTPEERRVIERHPLIGGDCLLAIKRRLGEDDFLAVACEVCFSHHERWDGNGYPFGLSGNTIPLPGRIVALADVYDALTSKRVYKEAMTHERARDVIVEGSGSQFDPTVVEAFLECEDEFARIARAASGSSSAPRAA